MGSARTSKRIHTDSIIVNSAKPLLWRNIFSFKFPSTNVIIHRSFFMNTSIPPKVHANNVGAGLATPNWRQVKQPQHIQGDRKGPIPSSSLPPTLQRHGTANSLFVSL